MPYNLDEIEPPSDSDEIFEDEKELKNLELFTQVKNFPEAERKYPIFAYYESKEAATEANEIE